MKGSGPAGVDDDFGEVLALARGFRSGLVATYALTLAENACSLAYPALTGWAVDGLLAREWRGLVALIAIWLVHLVIAFVRQRLDTRVFMGLYAHIATQVAVVQQQNGLGTSRVSARVEMTRDLVRFFEESVPALVRDLIAIVGSLAMLFFYDREAGGLATAVLVPATLVNVCYWRTAIRLNHGLNNQFEREVDAIASGRRFRIERHFGLLRRWRVKLSDAESWTWALTELATIAALVMILIDFTASPAFSAGAIYAVLSYVYDYLDGLNHIPMAVNHLAQIKDVRSRLKA